MGKKRKDEGKKEGDDKVGRGERESDLRIWKFRERNGRYRKEII